jgi:lysophospholipid hydrolase
MTTSIVNSVASSALSNSLPANGAQSTVTAALEYPPTVQASLFARVILAVLRVIPGLLYNIITFTSITLPTWLFTLFSMSISFTLNFTTL